MYALIKDNCILVYESFLYRESLKEMPNAQWIPVDKVWTLPLQDSNLLSLKLLGCELRGDLVKQYTTLISNDIKPETPIVEMPIRIKPYQHQIKGFNLAMKHKGYGLLFDMGLGKSITAVAVAAARFKENEVKRLLIICPSAVMPVWEREFTNSTIEYNLFLLEGPIPKRKERLMKTCNTILEIAVINFEGTWRMIEDLLRWKADMLIVDESQRIKNAKSRQSKAVHKLAKHTKYRMILTGTPVTGSPVDVYSQWKVIDENLFGPSFYPFRARYCIMGGFNAKQITGYKNLLELTEKAHSRALRVSKEEALDLPEQIDDYRYCRLDPEGERIYKSLQEDSYTKLSQGEVTVTNVLTQLLRLQQVTGGFVPPDYSSICKLVSRAKLELLKELLEDILGTDEKVIIFARFTAEIQAIKQLLEAQNITFEVLDGKSRHKGEIVSRFQEDDNVKVMLAQVSVGGVGITLHSASIVIYYSTTFNLGDYLQSRSRTHRIGQKRRCLYIHLICKDTIDEKILHALTKKEAIASAIVDNWKDYFKRGNTHA